MMVVAGAVLLVIASILNIWLPFNKNMWTSSYAVLMAGWASTFLGILFWIVDLRGLKRWATPFVIFGMNAIVVYVASEILAILLGVFQTTGPTGTPVSIQEYIYRSWFAPLASPANASLLFSIVFDGLMFLLAWALWKKRWFLKV